MFDIFTRRAAQAHPQKAEPDTVVTVYGTKWCAATQMVRRYLDRVGIPYTFRDLEEDVSAANQVKWWTGGYASHPTLDIGGDILIEPTMDEVKGSLMEHGLG
jgi:mycoredoxin